MVRFVAEEVRNKIVYMPYFGLCTITPTTQSTLNFIGDECVMRRTGTLYPFWSESHHQTVDQRIRKGELKECSGGNKGLDCYNPWMLLLGF